jgi:hypothetical protein
MARPVAAVPEAVASQALRDRFGRFLVGFMLILETV